MKVSVDPALWEVAGHPSSAKDCDFDFMADNIDSEIARVLSWVETELRTAVDGYNTLQKFIDSSTIH